MSEPRILILGPPGAGKGTQSANIADAFGVEHVTTGDALRANKEMDISGLDLEYDTPGEYMDRGELVPDRVVDAMVEEALADAGGFVLDGYPRNEAQVDHLETVSDLDVVLYLAVSHEELMDRLTGRRVCADCGANYHVEYDPPEENGVCDGCGGDLYRREDDNPDAVETRIEEYDTQTAPVIEHYEATGDLVRIDGEAAPDDVWERVRAAIEAETGDH
jgi:adenylate kinase